MTALLKVCPVVMYHTCIIHMLHVVLHPLSFTKRECPKINISDTLRLQVTVLGSQNNAYNNDNLSLPTAKSIYKERDYLHQSIHGSFSGEQN